MKSRTAPVKVVARFFDGQVLKGHTRNFDPMRPTFDLAVLHAGADEPPLPIHIQRLKAVFFVKDFEGDRDYDETKEFHTPFTGRRLAVRFKDGEVMVGTSFGYDASRDGFFLFPADVNSNNDKVFVVAAAVVEVTKLPLGASNASLVRRSV